MADYNFSDLKKKYNNFLRPLSVVKLGGKDFSANAYHFMISDMEIEITSDYEASIASFVIYNSFNKLASRYNFKELKEYIALGNSVDIFLGYEKSAKEVFRGFIAKVNFEAPKGGIPGIRITAMDVKGLMMSGSYSKQLLADNYSDAVNEILKKTNYEKMKKESLKGKSGGLAGAAGASGLASAAKSAGGKAGAKKEEDFESIITDITIDKTPDKQEGANAGGTNSEKKVTDKTIEMVSESDYEFVVKAAKKFNFEFFTIGGHVYFRRAKNDKNILMALGPETGMRSMDAQYEITGLVGSVEVRGIDVGKGKLINSKKKLNNKISQSGKARALVEEIEHIVIDPTISSKEDAECRADFISENIAYRLGTLHAEFTGLPELVPGRFIILKALGIDFNVKFYVTSVIHILDTDNNYTTKIIAKASSIENERD